MYEEIGVHIQEHEDAAEARIWDRLMIPQPKNPLLTVEDKEFLAALKVSFNEEGV